MLDAREQMQLPLIPAAIEDLYRRYAAVTTFGTCIKQTEIGGTTIMPGDKIAMPTTLANTDPNAWERRMTSISIVHRAMSPSLMESIGASAHHLPDGS